MTDRLLDEIRVMVPELARDAAEVDVQGAVDEAVIDRLDDLGLFRLFRPSSHGGSESDPVEFARAIRLLSRGCTATGWVASALASNEWHVALFDEGVRDEIWGTEGARSLIASCYIPDGTLRPAADGFVLSGRWRAAAGVHHAAWACLGAVLLNDAGEPADFTQVLVPAQDFTIERSWDPTGLRAIGADSIVVKDLVVRGHRLFGSQGRAVHGAREHLTQRSPVYRLPYSTVHTHALALPALGAAEGAYAALVADRPEAASLPVVARTVTDLHAAWRQMQRNLIELMDDVRANVVPDTGLAIRARRDQALLAERCSRAIGHLLDAAGAEAWGRHHPLQRAWREAQVARSNAVNHAEDVLGIYGRWAFGTDINDRYW
ncbi:acyl-CoA dehydrogenase family protein [Nocardioides sambongensis]|uniref:acyl-CoA dehydrogenase family protein n=1 Tax=Nocardioides sambongensis TaxID=2589074 RepID=UPI0015E86F5E|nr:acyl-CoA dehydrogenase family protein [Nocardioides sambongensis]